ncbi:hypothetical protein GCM10028807_50040 [Spirosoma daeguense]
MADLNVTYPGFVEDLPYKKVSYRCNGPVLNGWCVWGEEEVDESYNEFNRESTEQILAFNRASKDTVADVKVAYESGINRGVWLKDRIDAVNIRVNLIQERTAGLRTILVRNGQPDASEAIGLTISNIGAATIPVLGPIANAVLKSVIASDNAEQLAYAQTIVSRYSADVQELAAIKKQLMAEYATYGTTPTPIVTGGNPQTGNEAPSPNTTLYYYLAGFGLLMLVLLYLKNKRKNRR